MPGSFLSVLRKARLRLGWRLRRRRRRRPRLRQPGPAQQRREGPEARQLLERVCALRCRTDPAMRCGEVLVFSRWPEQAHAASTQRAKVARAGASSNTSSSAAAALRARARPSDLSQTGRHLFLAQCAHRSRAKLPCWHCRKQGRRDWGAAPLRLRLWSQRQRLQALLALSLQAGDMPCCRRLRRGLASQEELQLKPQVLRGATRLPATCMYSYICASPCHAVL